MPILLNRNKKRNKLPPRKRIGHQSSADPINKNLELALGQFLDFLEEYERREKTKNREGAKFSFGL
jgi:hypothetical protein